MQSDVYDYALGSESNATSTSAWPIVSVVWLLNSFNDIPAHGLGLKTGSQLGSLVSSWSPLCASCDQSMIIGSDYHSDNVKSFLQFAIQIVVALAASYFALSQGRTHIGQILPPYGNRTLIPPKMRQSNAFILGHDWALELKEVGSWSKLTDKSYARYKETGNVCDLCSKGDKRNTFIEGNARNMC